MSSDGARALLESGDVARFREAWPVAFPGLPAPPTDGEAEAVMHYARTKAISVSFRARAYSHAWLLERGLPSGLPDNLRPKAQRVYPVKALAVGISINYSDPLLLPAAREIRGVMENAVLDAHADGKLADSAFVTKRMNEARAKTARKLFGRRYGNTG